MVPSFFFICIIMGSKGAKRFGSVSKAKRARNAAASLAGCLAKNGETSRQAAVRARQQQAIDTRGIVAAEAMRHAAVKQRDESNAQAASATTACSAALNQLDLAEHLRGESDAAARAAQADKREAEAALIARQQQSLLLLLLTAHRGLHRRRAWAAAGHRRMSEAAPAAAAAVEFGPAGPAAAVASGQPSL